METNKVYENIVNLAPSDLTFLWDECPRCFYLKVKEGQRRPSTPFPAVFNRLDKAQKNFFKGRPVEEVDPSLPAGIVAQQDVRVHSAPIDILRRDTAVTFRGEIDTVLAFNDGSYGIIDFKTTETKANLVERYSRQLHAYAWAAETPAEGKPLLDPVSRLGLFCFEPYDMVALNGDFAFRASPTWIEAPRDDGAFLRFLSDVLDVVEAPNPPAAGERCQFCQLRDAA